MRLIKMFGLAALAAAALMAFVGVTSASAVTELEKVVLCKAHESPCSAPNTLGGGTGIDGELVSGTKAVLLSSLGNIECSTSTTKGATLTGQTLAHGEITSLTFSSCEDEGTPCTVTSEHLNYLVKGELTPPAEVGKPHPGTYELLVTETTHGQPQAHVTCGLFINCTFGSASVLFEALLEPTDTVLDVLQELGRSGGLCPSTSVWHAKYLARCLEGTTLIGCWLEMEQ